MSARERRSLRNRRRSVVSADVSEPTSVESVVMPGAVPTHDERSKRNAAASTSVRTEVCFIKVSLSEGSSSLFYHKSRGMTRGIHRNAAGVAISETGEKRGAMYRNVLQSPGACAIIDPRKRINADCPTSWGVGRTAGRYGSEMRKLRCKSAATAITVTSSAWKIKSECSSVCGT